MSPTVSSQPSRAAHNVWKPSGLGTSSHPACSSHVPGSATAPDVPAERTRAPLAHGTSVEVTGAACPRRTKRCRSSRAMSECAAPTLDPHASAQTRRSTSGSAPGTLSATLARCPAMRAGGREPSDTRAATSWNPPEAGSRNRCRIADQAASADASCTRAWPGTAGVAPKAVSCAAATSSSASAGASTRSASISVARGGSRPLFPAASSGALANSASRKLGRASERARAARAAAQASPLQLLHAEYTSEARDASAWRSSAPGPAPRDFPAPSWLEPEPPPYSRSYAAYEGPNSKIGWMLGEQCRTPTAKAGPAQLGTTELPPRRLTDPQKSRGAFLG